MSTTPAAHKYPKRCRLIWNTIGVDLHKRDSHLGIGHGDETISERRTVTSREQFTEVLGGQPPGVPSLRMDTSVGECPPAIALHSAETDAPEELRRRISGAAEATAC